jgi:glutathione S-transferase
MKLYENKHAPNPRRVRIFLAEKGIEIPTVQVNIMEKECQTPEFTAKNAMQRLPVLEFEDGTCLSESVAICRYFEMLHPDPPLMGRGARGVAEVEMWNRRMELDLLWPVTFAVRHTRPAMAELQIPQVPEWGEANRGFLEKALAWLDAELAGHPYIVGQNFTIADITAICAVGFMRVIGRKIGDDTPNLLRWHEAMAARPSFTA